jgi:hypothetical protein
MDRRKNYKPFKITILELWFRFEYFGIETFVNRIGIRQRQINRVINEWKNNDGCLIVESKMNQNK